ncbi:MAG TPA: baseplate J/gp47 family protein [Solirubrobacterales bacterium]|nr:baseplate J/gp47 family protein [Solirubrobacterales bacterium]
MASPLVELFNDVDARALEEAQVAAIQARFPDWEPNEGSPEWWDSKNTARVGAGLYDVASVMLPSAFQAFGETIVNVPRILAAPATVSSTWEAIDAAGPYTIPAKTQVDIVEGDTSYGFRTVAEVTIPAGKTTTAAGEVLLEAVRPGAEYNGLSGTAVLRDGLAKLKPDGVTLAGVTANGVDEEDEDAYLTRLAEELQTLTMSAVKSRDYSILARRVAGVARAVTLDNYNPADGTFGNPLMVSVAVVDAAGAALSAPVKEAVEELLEDRSLEDVVTHVIDPTYTNVDVVVSVAVAPGYEVEAVAAAVEAHLAEYLSPGNWGLPKTVSADPGNSAGWEEQTIVYYNEIIAQVDRVAGVDRVQALWLGGSGGGWKAFTASAAEDKFTTLIDHGYAEGEVVLLRAGLTGAAPLEPERLYFVRDVTAKTFKLAAASGGPAINLTADGEGVVVRMKQADTALNGVAALPTPKTIVAIGV